MKLLVDENISYRILKQIDTYFPGSVHVMSIKDSRITDSEIWGYAKKHNFVVATYDEGFYEWKQLRDYPPYLYPSAFKSGYHKKNEPYYSKNSKCNKVSVQKSRV